eukprot:563323-Karenia_brevis.AAC.1
MEIHGVRARADQVSALSQTHLRTEQKQGKAGKDMLLGKVIQHMIVGIRMRMDDSGMIRDHGKVLKTQDSGA